MEGNLAIIDFVYSSFMRKDWHCLGYTGDIENVCRQHLEYNWRHDFDVQSLFRDLAN
jgi:hypothetical protein